MLIDTFDSLFGAYKMHRLQYSNIDTSVFFDELFEANDTLRFTRPTKEWPHREAHHVFLRVPNMKNKSGFPGNVTASQKAPLYAEFPMLTAWIEQFAEERGGVLGRIVITNLAPHKQVYRHADRGLYFAARDRYHLVLKSEGGIMRIAGQSALMRQGELWWIQNKASHEAFNNSDRGRIHLIIDILPDSLWSRAKNVFMWLYFGLRPRRFTNYYFNWPSRYQATS